MGVAEPPQQQPWQPAPWQPAPRRMNPLAVVSLVFGVLQIGLWFIGAAVAIITGHIARHQIRRTGDNGSGMALAGLILGYVGLALSVLALVGIVTAVVTIGPHQVQSGLRDDAHRFGAAVVAEAAAENKSPRAPQVIRAAYTLENKPNQCCYGDTFTLPDRTPLDYALPADFAQSEGRIEISRAFLARHYVCVTLPATVNGFVTVVDGRCSNHASAASKPSSARTARGIAVS